MLYFISLLCLVLGTISFRSWSKKEARKRLLASGLSLSQKSIIAKQVPIVLRIPTNLHGKLEGKISLFLQQVQFIGCNGLEVTEEMRLSIAAQACLLVVNSDTWYTLSTVFIYEDAFKSKKVDSNGYVVTESEMVTMGESWSRGPVVLSWKHTEKGALNDRDGHNVVFHEFAHQIDDLSGHTDGAPLLNRGHSFTNWEHVFLNAYERHIDNIKNQYETVLDAYGASAHEEFFAVAVEAFFENPVALREQELEFYEELSKFFNLNPVTWK